MGPFLEKTCDHWSEDSIRWINTPSALARRTLFYVQEVGAFRTTPPYSTERANLPSYLIILTRSGRGVLELDDKTIELPPNSCLFLDCMRHHRYYTPVGETWDFLWVHFYGGGSADYYREFVRCGADVVCLEDSEAFAETMLRILTLQKEGTVSGELQTSLCIDQLLTRLLQSVACSGDARTARPAYLDAVVGELERAFSDDLSLEMLAEKNGVSKYHLSREFKRFMGLNFIDYLIRVRLNHAKELLRFTDLPVSQVTERCGFHDVSHFIRVFRLREGGLTPLQYRKQWT